MVESWFVLPPAYPAIAQAHYGARAGICISGRVVSPRHCGSGGLRAVRELDPPRPLSCKWAVSVSAGSGPKSGCSFGGAQASRSRFLSLTLSSGTIGASHHGPPPGVRPWLALSGLSKMHGSSGRGVGGEAWRLARRPKKGDPDVVPSEREVWGRAKSQTPCCVGGVAVVALGLILGSGVRLPPTPVRRLKGPLPGPQITEGRGPDSSLWGTPQTPAWGSEVSPTDKTHFIWNYSRPAAPPPPRHPAAPLRTHHYFK